MRALLFATILLFSGGFAAEAFAYNGFASGNVNMRAGPGTNYHRIATIPRGAPIVIHACIGGNRWCDVSYAGVRGWSSGRYLQSGHAHVRPHPRVVPRVAPRVVHPPVVYHTRPRHYRHHGYYHHHPRRQWGHHYGGFRSHPRPGSGRVILQFGW